MIGDKVRLLRELKGDTQASLANKLGISRSSVNAWEMGVSNISIKNVRELAILFNVSSDFLLEIDRSATVDVSGLSESQVKLIMQFVEHIKGTNGK